MTFQSFAKLDVRDRGGNRPWLELAKRHRWTATLFVLEAYLVGTSSGTPRIQRVLSGPWFTKGLFGTRGTWMAEIHSYTALGESSDDIPLLRIHLYARLLVFVV